ncbi:hypothetical protein [Vibrio splendidus]|uniref:Magnesium transporter n=1 Tax=Vibrio splendidus 12E03 TaxID=1191305 RepID=A0A1E5FTZ5_VIBSP|nr:hypothetical protein [Vibrio splendidus]OEF93986.1 magnesium transporter [Vibrio splendidus 12E03]
MYNSLMKKSKTLLKWVMFIGSFVSISYLFSLLSTVHGEELPEEYFSNGHPVIIGLLDSEFFMGLIFLVTFTVIAYVFYLLWQLHEIAVHKAEKLKSKQVNLVFALSLCGLFLHKAWWVIAVAIAFTDWVAISAALSTIISRGIKGTKEERL